IAMLVPLLLSERWHADPQWRRLGVFILGVVVSLLLYYGLWRAATSGMPSDGRYSPGTIGLHDVVANASVYSTKRMAQLFGFWDTRAGARPYVREALALLVIGFVVDLAGTGSHRLRRAGMWMIAALAIVVVDAPLFFAPPANTFSYMTSGPAAAATFLLVALAGRS